MNSKEYKMPDGRTVVFWNDENEIGQISLEAMDTIMSMIPKWIPVSELLPKELAEVNITWVNHEPEQYYYNIKDKPFAGTGIYYKGKWYWDSSTCADYLAEYGHSVDDEMDDSIEVIAWMPLPEPYKEDKK